jgi:hypothetical protein
MLVVGGTVLAMMAVFISIALWKGEPRRASAAPIDRAAQAKRRALWQDAKIALLKNGTITKITCAEHEAQADVRAWALTSLDTKKQAVETLSRICEAETGFAHLKVLDNRSGRTLAEFSVWSGVTMH